MKATATHIKVLEVEEPQTSVNGSNLCQGDAGRGVGDKTEFILKTNL